MHEQFLAIPRLMLSVLPLLFLCGCLGTVTPLSDPLPAGLTVWQGEVHIRGDLEVPVDAALQIRPGTEVIFHPGGDADRRREHPHFPGSELIVSGRLVAEGTAEAPIRFRSIDPDAPAGSWGGINLVASPDARFAYCLFRQADSAVHSQESRVTIRESVFEQNLVAIRFHSSIIVIEHNLIRDNGAGIRFHYGAPTIRFNRIVSNGKGIFMTSEPRDLQIRDNVLLGNCPYHVVLGAAVSDDVDLSHNWWGGLTDDDRQRLFFDAERDPELGRVLLEPRLPQAPDRAGPSWTP